MGIKETFAPINRYLQLLGHYLNNEKPNDFSLSEEEIEGFTKFAHRHSLSALTYKALSFIGVESKQLEQRYYASLKKSVLFEQERKELYEYLNENQIDFLPLKGIILKDYYPDATCSLNFNTPFEITIAVMLSAQCTDERVNKTTPILFDKYNDPKQMENINIDELEKIIYPCGFYKNKAKNIKACSKKIVEDYNGIVPNNIKAFHNPQGIAVDTHVKRISNKIGFSIKKEPEKIEQDLLKQIPKEYYYDVNHLFVWHGRKTCTARNPKCDVCPINMFCDDFNNKI